MQPILVSKLISTQNPHCHHRLLRHWQHTIKYTRYTANVFCVYSYVFTARRVCIARICHGKMSVRPSVCHTPVLCLNRYRYPQLFSPWGSPTILVFPYQTGWRYSDGNPPNGGVECKGYDKMTIFSQIFRSISETVIARWAHAARQFVSIKFSFHPYNIQRDCPRGVPRGNQNMVKQRFLDLRIDLSIV